VHPPGQVIGQHLEAGLERREERQVCGVGRPTHCDQHVGQHVHRVAQRRHLELDRHRAQLFDRPRPTGVPPTDERHGLAPPLDEGGVQRVLEDRGVPVVVLRGEQHVAVGPVDDLAESGNRVVASEPVHDPGRHQLAEPTLPGGPGDDLEPSR
jgi:hypothetical protein